MIERELTITNRLGLHARATAKLVQVVSGFRCGVTVAAKGREAQAAMDAITELLANKFGEEEAG